MTFPKEDEKPEEEEEPEVEEMEEEKPEEGDNEQDGDKKGNSENLAFISTISEFISKLRTNILIRFGEGH